MMNRFCACPGQTKTAKIPLEAAQRFEVFEKDELGLAKGDRIRITCNGITREQTRIYNAQIFDVTGISKAGDIHLGNGKTLGKNYGNFTHGHVMTSYASQGKTCDDIFIAQSEQSFGATNKKQFYVSASRARKNNKNIYAR